ncbi:hypothetical protein B0F90DRAFT_1920960 [Multifurca ochricompacta]|uniref:Uncharacterized protein n=1 Tax=Multifurca ochricompacta TaxID=376703 RepID=A0AAD4LWD7_9AGAM|nr:hypothetical protein B0F90DRAFT_1920960 [Multifurca ochricompacta]
MAADPTSREDEHTSPLPNLPDCGSRNETRNYFRYPLSIDILNMNPVQATIDNQRTSTAEDNIPVEEPMQKRSLLEFRDFGISDPQYYLPSIELFELYEKNQTPIGDGVLETGGFVPNDFPVLKAPSQALNDYIFDVDTQRTVQPVPDAETGGSLPNDFPVLKAPSQALNDYGFDVDTQRPVQPVPVCTTPPSLKGALPQNRGAKGNETAGNPFKCPCGSRYEQQQGLNRHKRDKHKPKKRCDLCPDFMWPEGRRYIYKKHVREKHGLLYDHIFN